MASSKEKKGKAGQGRAKGGLTVMDGWRTNGGRRGRSMLCHRRHDGKGNGCFK